MTDTNRIASVIGEVVGEIVREQLSADPDGAMLLVADFRREEVACAVATLRGLRLGAFEVRVVVIAREPWPGVDATCLLPPDKSATTFRSGGGGPLVFFRVEEHSDQQSLGKIKTIDDRSLLWTRTTRKSRLGLLAAVAWRHCAGPLLPMPLSFAALTGEVFDALAIEGNVSLRRWVKFATSVAELVAERGQAADERTVEQATGASLTALGLLPDEGLYALGSRHQRARRLQRNAWYSNGRDRAGREAEPDEVLQTAERCRFVDAAGAPYDEGAARQIVDGIKNRLYRGPTAATPTFRIWDQLYAPETQRRGLGERIQEWLSQRHPERLDEFDEDLARGLDEGDSRTARDLIDSPAPEGLPPLLQVVDPPLVRAVHKVAFPAARNTSEPLRDLAREVYELVEEAEERVDACLFVTCERPRDHSDEQTRALFALLYGRTLLDIASGDGLRVRLAVDTALTDPGNPFPVSDVASDESDDGTEWEWPALRLGVKWRDDERLVRRLDWKPDVDGAAMLFAFLLRTPAVPCWDAPDLRFETWMKGACAGPDPLPGASKLPVISGPTAEWLEERGARLSAWGTQGIAASELSAYVDRWSLILNEVFTHHVPRGVPNSELDAFLRVDTFRSKLDVALLGTHPIKLRWLAAHLHEMVGVFRSVMDGDCALAPVNDEFYFDRLALLSSHAQPPLLTADGALYLAVREVGGHELFAKARETTRDVRDWLSDVDDESVHELARVVDAYVDAYPHTSDGLSIAIVVQAGGAALVRRVVRQVRTRVGRRGEQGLLKLHIVAPRSEFPEMERNLAEFDIADERRHGDFPRLAVVFHPWDRTEVLPGPEALGPQLEGIDVAVVPNLFGAHTRPQEGTRRSTDAGGSGFQPWIDPPTELQTSIDGAAHATRLLVPQRHDQVLEHWSTVNVRHFRHQPVGATGADDVDFLTLQVSFDRASEFYRALHERARWVVTLDEFVARDQVEALQHRPDVITVKTGIGSAKAYTLVVSSMGGRPFVEERLTRRLRAYVPGVAVDYHTVAAELYARARVLSPGLLLRASGLGRTAQELVGLVLARWQAARHFPLKGARLFEAWIPLDEYAEWFGSTRGARADLLRITATEVDEKIRIRAWVVEAKLRTGWSTAQADQQVSNTIALVRHALQVSPRSPTDGAFWRRALLDAVEQLSKETQPAGSFRTEFSSFVAWHGTIESSRLQARVREAWLDGRFELEAVDGVVCTVCPDADAPNEEAQRTAAGHTWLRIGRSDLPSALCELIGVAAIAPDAPPGRDRPQIEAPPASPAHQSAIRPKESSEFVVVEPSHPRSVDAALAAAGPSSQRAPSTNLEAHYQRVLDVFTEFGVKVRRPETQPYREGPGFYVFRVAPGDGVPLERVKRQTEQLKLKLGLPSEFTPRSYVDRGAVVFEVPKPDDERYFVASENMWSRWTPRGDALAAPLGEDIQGDIVDIDFSSSDSPHLLVAGTTGSGKSVVLETLLFGLTRAYEPDRLKLVLVDPKGTELQLFERSEHLLFPIGMDAADTIDYLDKAVAEMERRRHVFREVRVRTLPEYNAVVSPEKREPWWLVMLDEYADLTSDKDDKREVEARLQRLCQKARASGIHVVVATQKPSAEVISTTIRSNLPAQLALRVKTASDSRIIMDEAGAETLAGKGDAFLKTARGLVRLQCARVTTPR